MFLLTSAPRSEITHALSGGPVRNFSHETVCGREIRETWAGEMSAAPAPGMPSCQRCREAVATDVERGITKLQPAHIIGERVGILAGLQSVGGPFIDDHGTVTRVAAYWGSFSYLVKSETTGETMVYEPSLIRSLTVDETHPDQLSERVYNGEVRKISALLGIAADADGLPRIGHPIWQEIDGSTSLLQVLRQYRDAVPTFLQSDYFLTDDQTDTGDALLASEQDTYNAGRAAGLSPVESVERALAMRRHPAGKSLQSARVIAGETVDGVRVLSRNYANAYMTRPYLIPGI